MSVALRVLDDGAWVSVNDERRVSVSELWRVAGGSTPVCACACADFVVEGFTDVGVNGRTVTADVYGQCIRCGTDASVRAVPVGRVVDGEFRSLAAEAVRFSGGGLGAPATSQRLPVPGSVGED
ncbi:hypothetical protein [Halobaculum gomorrense]|uniref:DUF8134 domain-containing protein n=1 Tax=Halobaculum gomorrense TaxID=43928 RepID=A0A1M5MV09_9EURY|nr:hypothetical protein [Halobaculum gomorrense]SHG81154.1 hypothetical protein SAMN05443636_1159 [Halobaculum gomorrense]